MALKISKGKQQRPQKVVIYGPEGIGKSTLASQFPNPVFLDIEGGTAQLDVPRVDGLKNWHELQKAVKELASLDDFQTVVIDTADWAERLCTEDLLKRKNVIGIEDIGYGKGYTYLAESFAKFLELLNVCLDNGKNVVVLAHAKMRKFEQPDEQGAYDRWELKLTKQTAPILKEWGDMVLFLNYKTIVKVNKDGKAKASGGKRIIYTSHNACWDAKNRHGLPEEMPLEWDGPLAAIFTADVPAPLLEAQAVLGGEVKSLEGKAEGKLSNADVIRKLLVNPGYTENEAILVLTRAKMCSEDVSSLDDVDANILEGVIQNWQDFAEQISYLYVDIPF